MRRRLSWLCVLWAGFFVACAPLAPEAREGEGEGEVEWRPERYPLPTGECSPLLSGTTPVLCGFDTWDVRPGPAGDVIVAGGSLLSLRGDEAWLVDYSSRRVAPFGDELIYLLPDDRTLKSARPFTETPRDRYVAEPNIVDLQPVLDGVVFTEELPGRVMWMGDADAEVLVELEEGRLGHRLSTHPSDPQGVIWTEDLAVRRFDRSTGVVQTLWDAFAVMDEHQDWLATTAGPLARDDHALYVFSGAVTPAFWRIPITEELRAGEALGLADVEKEEHADLPAVAFSATSYGDYLYWTAQGFGVASGSPLPDRCAVYRTPKAGGETLLLTDALPTCALYHVDEDGLWLGVLNPWALVRLPLPPLPEAG